VTQTRTEILVGIFVLVGVICLAYLAVRSQAVMVPGAIEGTPGFPSLNPSRHRLGGASVRFGRGFRFRAEIARPGREELRRMTDEAMYVLSALLPEQRRGVYADLDQATTDTVEFV